MQPAYPLVIDRCSICRYKFKYKRSSSFHQVLTLGWAARILRRIGESSKRSV